MWRWTVIVVAFRQNNPSFKWLSDMKAFVRCLVFPSVRSGESAGIFWHAITLNPSHTGAGNSQTFSKMVDPHICCNKQPPFLLFLYLIYWLFLLALKRQTTVCFVVHRAVQTGWPGVSWLRPHVLQPGLPPLAGPQSCNQEAEVRANQWEEDVHTHRSSLQRISLWVMFLSGYLRNYSCSSCLF